MVLVGRYRPMSWDYLVGVCPSLAGGVGVTWAEKGTIYEGRHLKLRIGRLQNQVELDSADIST